MQYNLTLAAGQSLRQQTSGSFFLLQAIGAATSVDIQFFVNAQTAEHITTAGRGLKAKLGGGQRFSEIVITSAVATTVSFIISDGLVDISQLDGANVFVNNNGTPIQTANDRGSAGNPVFINGTVAGLPAAAVIVNDAPAAITAAFSAIVALNVNRVSLRMTNTGGNVVALGAAGLTFANGAILLQPGDTWIEERAANLAWGGICGAALASTIAFQEVTA